MYGSSLWAVSVKSRDLSGSPGLTTAPDGRPSELGVGGEVEPALLLVVAVAAEQLLPKQGMMSSA